MNQTTQSTEDDKVFAFVNFAHPNQMKDQTRRSLVHTHVGKYYRNRSKPAQRSKLIVPAVPGQATKASGGSLDGRRLAPEAVSSGNPLCYTEELVETLVKKTQWLHRLAADDGRRRKLEEDEETYSWVEASYRAKKYILTEHLDQSRRDPFGRYPVDRFRSCVPVLVDHAVRHFWTCLSPDRCYGVANPVNNVYLAHMRSSLLAYYTYTLVISTNIEFLCHTHPSRTLYQAMRAEHICAATQLVREAIQRMPKNPGPEHVSDDLIGSIMALASCHQITVVSRRYQPVSRFCSPLATFQGIDMWGTLPFLQPHRLAVVQLVNLRGGLLKLGSLYLAGVAQLNDLVDASRNTSKPLLEWQNIMEPLPELTWPLHDDKCSSSGNAPTSSFVPLVAAIHQSPDLENAIGAIAHTTAALHAYRLHGHPSSSIVNLVESRNRAQHLTLSLPSDCNLIVSPKSQDGLGDPDLTISIKTPLSRCLYEVVRLSLLIYNNLVVYPMPPISTVDARLTRSLRVALDRFFVVNCSTTAYRSTWLVWALILGGISDENDELRDWYRGHFCRLLEVQPKLHEWENLANLLSSFLWCGFILDEEAQNFWSQCLSELNL